MVINEWSQCPACKMCANFSDLKRVLESEQICPMCEAQVHPMQVKISDDPAADFKNLVTLMKDTNEEEEQENEGASDDDAQLLN